MSLLVLFNQGVGGTVAPFVPAGIPAVVIGDVYTPVNRIRGAWSPTSAVASPVTLLSRLNGVYASTVQVSDVYQGTVSVKGIPKTST